MQAVRLAGWPAACHCPPPTLFQQNDASQRRQERGIVHSTTRATTHGNSRAPPPDLTGLCCWPHTPPAGFPLSIAPPLLPQPYTYLNSSQLVEMFLAWMMRKNLLKLIGICKKLMILQVCRQPSLACWYFYQNRKVFFFVTILDY